MADLEKTMQELKERAFKLASKLEIRDEELARLFIQGYLMGHQDAMLDKLDKEIKEMKSIG